jgi:hypothetical protein
MVPETEAVRPELTENPFVRRFHTKGCAIFLSLSSAWHEASAVFPRRVAAVRVKPDFHISTV